MAAGVHEDRRVAGVDHARPDARPVAVAARPAVHEQDRRLRALADDRVGDRGAVGDCDRAVLGPDGVLAGCGNRHGYLTRAARSAATSAGWGSTGRSFSLVTPLSTRANRTPRATARRPSVEGRSPTAVEPSRSPPSLARTRSTMGAWGLPATVGSTPAAVATAARMAPPPGIGPSGVG